MAPIVYPFRLSANMLELAKFAEDESSAWTASWDSSQTAPDTPFEVTLTRTPYMVRDVTPEILSTISATTGTKGTELVHKTATGSFQLCTGDVGAACESRPVEGRKANTYFVTASDLPTMAKRCLDAHMLNQSDDELEYRFVITIDYGSGNLLQYDTELVMDFTQPATLRETHMRSIERMAHVEMTITTPDVTREVSPPVELDTYDDMTEVSGDVYARPISEAGVVATLEPLMDAPGIGELQSAALCVDVSPTAKYTALAAATCRIVDSGDKILIIGDHPGTLGQALVAKGRSVFGVDPLNTTTTTLGLHGRGDYATVEGTAQLLEGAFSVLDRRDNHWQMPDGLGAVIIDAVSDGESAEVSTARNLALAHAVRARLPRALVVVQLRSAPLVYGHYGVMELPGHSNQGCEAYAALLNDDHVLRGAQPTTDALCWATVRVGEKDAEAAGVADHHDSFYFRVAGRLDRDSHIVTSFFRPWDQDMWPDAPDRIYGRGGMSAWYHFVVSRALYSACEDDRRGKSRRMMEARNPVEMYAVLQPRDASAATADRLRNVFNPDSAEGLTGVTPGLFNRHPQLRELVRIRYEALSRLTHFEESVAPQEIADLFTRPASGVLLRGLSSIRSLDAEWRGLKIARYKRVLPYEYMAVLASRPKFHAIYMHVFACMQGLGKPMHAWELQHTLWTLTMHGTEQERLRYLGGLLQSVILPVPTGRRAPPLGPGKDRLLVDFERNLRVMGLAESYSQADRGYDDARTRIFARTRDDALNPYKPRAHYAADVPMSDAPMPPPLTMRPPAHRHTNSGGTARTFNFANYNGRKFGGRS